MSKTALLSLFALSICVIAYYASPQASFSERVSAVAIFILALSFISAMLIGRKVRFDPHLD